MGYRELAAEYAALAKFHTDLARDVVEECAEVRQPIPTDRAFMSRLNLAKTCGIVSQAYSALVATTPAEPRVVTL